MVVTTHNDQCSTSFSRALVGLVSATKVYSGLGAHIVMQSLLRDITEIRNRLHRRRSGRESSAAQAGLSAATFGRRLYTYI
jgi:hypothetical protein